MTSLQTNRLILRRPDVSDLDDLHQVFSDPRAMRYWSTLPHTDPAQTEAFILAMQGLHDAGGAEFVVEYKARAIGKVGIFDAPEIGFIFHPDSWGKGIGTEAASAVISHGFATLGLDRVTADVDPRNAASISLLTALGFVETGRASGTLQLGEELCDSIYFAVTRQAWQARSDGLSGTD
ncbi:MAG: GNAT family N-acetyltransferase [Pseudomonadota bacterium]